MKGKSWGWIEENKERIIELSDTVWEYAELGLVEERSSKLLSDELEGHGFSVEMGVAGMPTAFVATWSDGASPTIGLIGEFDALPGLSNGKVPRKEPLRAGSPARARIPSKILSGVVTANMRAVGAPSYTRDELAFATEIAKSFPREQKVDSLRKLKLPNYERYLDVDLVRDILDPWNEGEVSGSSTDVADVSWQIPTMEFGTAALVIGAPGHSWQTVACSGTSLGHKSLIFAAKTMAGSVLDLLTKSELLENAKEEHASKMQGRTYRCAIPDEIGPPIEVARIAAAKLG